MSLPTPIPDDPRKWLGWNQYRSDNFYERLCLDWRQAPADSQIEDHCRQLLVWWKKKLPLKNQPSNPIAQLLRAGLDEAPMYLTEARSQLINPTSRQSIDAELRQAHQASQLSEIRRFVEFSVSAGVLSIEARENLLRSGRELGVGPEEVNSLINEMRESLGFEFETEADPPPPASSETAFPDPPPHETAAGISPTPSAEDDLIRMLRMANIEDSLSYEQQQTFIGMGQSLGLSEEQAEAVVERFADELIFGPGGAPTPAKSVSRVSTPSSPAIEMTPAEEMARFELIRSPIVGDFLFIPSNEFTMGAERPPATPQERPLTRVILSRYYLARLPVTNAQYEKFDPAHRTKRAPWAGDDHPVVYVTYSDAVKFCQWLSKQENRRFRLPTEAEWEFAARGLESRIFPWGDHPDNPMVCNFADAKSNFPWSDRNFDCGFSQTSPVGAFPRGASPFGMLDMAGNVFEWVHDYFDAYKGGTQKNPKGPPSGSKRSCRGGSWRTRITACRTSARAFNTPDYQFNDLGFRVACDCPAP